MKRTGYTAPFTRVQPTLAFAAAHLSDIFRWRALGPVGLSLFQSASDVSSVAGEDAETVQCTVRLRLSRAAA